MANRPADLLNAPERPAERRGKTFAVFKLVGDEVRAREEVQKHIARDHALIKRQAGRVLAEIHRQLAAADFRAELLDVQHTEGVE